MYELTIGSTQPPLLTYLQTESTEIRPSVFGFTSPKQAASVLSSFLLPQLIDRTIDGFIRSRYFAATRRNDFYAYIPESRLHAIRTTAVSELLPHLTDAPFDVEAVIRFSLRATQRDVSSLLHASLYDFVHRLDERASTDWIDSFFHAQPTQTVALSLSVGSDGEAALMNNQTIIHTSPYAHQQDVIGHLIHEKPMHVTVYDPQDLLQPEFVVLLKSLFRAKVVFLREPYPFHPHP